MRILMMRVQSVWMESDCWEVKYPLSWKRLSQLLVSRASLSAIEALLKKSASLCGCWASFMLALILVAERTS